MNPASRIPKRVRPMLGVFIGGIAFLGIFVFEMRPPIDPGVWLWALLLIGAVFAISVPVASRLKRHQDRPKFSPWPVAVDNPSFGKPIQLSGILLEGRLTWTPQIFKRMARAFVRYTPSGKNHRREIFALYLIGIANITFGTVSIWRRELLAGLGLLAVSPLLIVQAESSRIRVPREIRAGAQVRWTLSSDKFTMTPLDSKALPREGRSTLVRSRDIDLSYVQAIIRTPAGFIIWPGDLVDIWLPVEAFATAEQVESFHEIARSCVANYVYQSHGC